ncbi:Rieske (2Fe-2S) protein [Amycolatopsis acidiphila]|uniref:Cytochrome bc1 complex Rieske iron-sulfur subunit n=1 Tax=Amycolatopsis acidiphila TaxID=715473 RepID=A0A557ZUH2_9PSEU|nr:Rieske (2Fe-2S) protein [Amycolatopsis acidiphila]TVT15671.1 Rieske (2Fe-2S) protein [Amycolatopsis acidiphila]UIJ56740.1 Rieske (2Fe-2S) protein [Amycolatopsis acidiphila]GHG55408.1 iron-sulfur protein [Amycolatopsis acidiphila]
MTAETPTRRTVLTTGIAAAGAAAGAVALAACGTDSGPSSSSGGGSGDTVAPAPSGTAVGTISDVQVGKCKSVTVNGQAAILARPTESSAACFSAICTHQGCTVNPDGNQLKCPCHGSVFDALTGAVVKGPAESPLPSIAVKVDGSSVVTA